ncbi:hypothetical protein GCM10010394_55340 [Streptomyces crystallinus]|uniref:Integral membrane protein n=1 Tax=Streptomyces crystallinus TaxID=68191 RepID=A0ABN1GSE2_9ACTN
MGRFGERTYGSKGSMRRNALITYIIGVLLLIVAVPLTISGNAAGWFVIGLVAVVCSFVFIGSKKM